MNHTHSHRQTHTQILLVTKCPICSKKWQSLRALKAPLFSCLKGVFLSWQTLVWSSVWFVTFLIDRRDIGGMSTPMQIAICFYLFMVVFFFLFFFSSKHSKCTDTPFADKSWSGLPLKGETIRLTRQWFIIIGGQTKVWVDVLHLEVDRRPCNDTVRPTEGS